MLRLLVYNSWIKPKPLMNWILFRIGFSLSYFSPFIMFTSPDSPKEKNIFPLRKSKNYIIGIGINSYTYWSPLNNAVKDITDITTLLINHYQFEKENTFILKNEEATRDNIIETFEKHIEIISENDNLIIFYSGHGHLHPLTQKGYWIPVDARKAKSGDFISNNRVLELLGAIKAKHILLVSDSCFSGSLFHRGATRSELGIEDLETRKSRWGLCSGRHDELVYDGIKGINSPFAGSILKVLKENSLKKMNVMKLIDPVTINTRNQYNQLPEGQPLVGLDHKGGQFIFERRLDEIKVWNKAKSINTIESYSDYIHYFPKGKFRAEAKGIISHLIEDELWNETIKSDTVKGYHEYIIKYPTGRYVNKANQRIYNLEDHRKYMKAKTSNLLNYMLDYVTTFPEGIHLQKVRKMIDRYYDKDEDISIKEMGSSSLKIPMVRVDGGIFEMGSEKFNRERPIHSVKVNSFFIGQYPITFDQYDQFCNYTSRIPPSDNDWGRGKRPVVNISWFDALAFCNWLSQIQRIPPFYKFSPNGQIELNYSSKGYRLPTEAEWEYAASGGHNRVQLNNDILIENRFWFDKNSNHQTQPVGLKQPNQIGMFDYLGNVYEWCYDYWNHNWYKQLDIKKVTTNPIGPVSGEDRVIRGGSFRSKLDYCRVTYRENCLPTSGRKFVGFRVANS